MGLALMGGDDEGRRGGVYDESRADAFQSKMLGVLNGGALALLCSVGRQTDLFDTMDGLGPVRLRRSQTRRVYRSGMCGSGSLRWRAEGSWSTTLGLRRSSSLPSTLDP
jgi:hypothetical protein